MGGEGSGRRPDPVKLLSSSNQPELLNKSIFGDFVVPNTSPIQTGALKAVGVDTKKIVCDNLIVGNNNGNTDANVIGWLQGGHLYLGDEANLSRVIALRRNGAAVGGLTSVNSEFNLYGGPTSAAHMTLDSSGRVRIGAGSRSSTNLFHISGAGGMFILSGASGIHQLINLGNGTGGAGDGASINFAISSNTATTSATIGAQRTNLVANGDTDFFVKLYDQGFYKERFRFRSNGNLDFIGVSGSITKALSGSLFVSGGALHYLGDAGTLTRLAVS